MSSNKALNLKIQVNDTEVSKSFNEVNKQYYKARGSVNKLTEGTKEWVEANRNLAKVEAERKDIIERQRKFRAEIHKNIDATEDQVSAMQDFGVSVTAAFSSLKSGDAMGFRTAMMGVTGGIKAATAAAWKFIATPIGIALAALAGVALIAKEWINYNEAAAEANRTTQQITQLSGEALDDARVRATALEKTFGTDFKESLEIARNLVKAFGISYEEAFDTMQNGMIRGGAANDEFMKSMREYPKLFAQAGFTISDFQRIVNTGIDLGVYDDKLPDAIKEFSLSVMEQTQASRDGLENAFGQKFTNELFKNINNGSITVKDALKLVAKEAENIGLNAQQSQQLTADLFRGAGEDAGGALLIFEAVTKSLIEQERALTPLEEQLQRTIEANLALADAQDEALKSDKYAAFSSELSITWTNAKAQFYEFITWMSGGLISLDTKFRKFVFQSVQYVKDAFTIGADADWDKLGKKFDEQQKKIEKAGAERQKNLLAEKDKNAAQESPEYKANQAAEKAKRDAEDAAAAAAAKLKDERAKAALASEKKRLDTLDQLQAEYTKRKEDREADSALKKVELDRARELKKAEDLRAGQATIDAINAEFDIKADEAKTEEEAKELERLTAFQQRKRDLLNELELQNKETDLEKDIEEEEQRYEKEQEKFELELEKLKLNKEEKDLLIELMEEKHQAKLLEIQEKAKEKQNAQEKKWMDASIQASLDLEDAKKNAAYSGLAALQGIFDKKTAIYKVLFLAEKGLAAAEVITAAAKSLASITANTAAANAAAVAASPLTAGMPWVGINTSTGIAQAAAVKLNAGASLATIAGAAITGFYDGGHTGNNGLGFLDASGKEPVGYVHANEYVIPEVLRKDPEMPQIERYIENKRRKKLGLYYNGGETSEAAPAVATNSGGSSSNELLEGMLSKLLTKLEEPWVVENHFGFEAMQKSQEAQRKLDKIVNRSQVKTP